MAETFTLVNTEVDNIRQAGVRRGINASIELTKTIRDMHKQSTPEWNALQYALLALQDITVEGVEG